MTATATFDLAAYLARIGYSGPLTPTLAVLAEGFDLHFPAGTRFGSPGAPWPV